MTAPLLNIQPPGAHRPHGVAVLRLGFRPFYLCAAALAVINVGWWALFNLGWVAWPAPMSPLLWHAHEMLFGFAMAVIIGFLFTAAKNWTQLQTPRGLPLMALVLLWLAARMAAVTGPVPLFEVLDLALLPIVAWILWRLLLRAGNRRNAPLVGILLLLALANLGFHLSTAGVVAVTELQTLHAALGLIVVLETVMGGRVIPGFTMSALPAVRIAPHPRLDRASIALAAAGLALWVADAQPALTGVALLLASVVHLWRWLRWQPWKSRSLPLLWILHAAYAWIPVGLALLGLAQWTSISTSLGIHALAVGATGGLILGMMMRTARGHTGRTLQTRPAEIVALWLVIAAAVVRVVPVLAWPAVHHAAVYVAALLWCTAFAVYLWVYTPWLVGTRADDRDG